MENKKSKLRTILVILFILIFSLISFISLRGTYLEYKELGEIYIQVFVTRLKYISLLFGGSVVISIK